MLDFKIKQVETDASFDEDMAGAAEALADAVINQSEKILETLRGNGIEPDPGMVQISLITNFAANIIAGRIDKSNVPEVLVHELVSRITQGFEAQMRGHLQMFAAGGETLQ